LSIITIKNIEGGKSDPRLSTVDALGQDLRPRGARSSLKLARRATAALGVRLKRKTNQSLRALRGKSAGDSGMKSATDSDLIWAIPIVRTRWWDTHFENV
jgi:hypothetical protein